MANALLYYRTDTTKISQVPDPQNLPSGQKLEFIFPDDILEGIDEEYANNIKAIPSPNQDGVRQINLQENGISSYKFTIRGVFGKNVANGITKLKTMRVLKQVDIHHVYGRFGLEIDNASKFSIGPTSIYGLYIDATNIGYAGQRTTRYDFSVTLGVGGIINSIV